MKPLTISPLGTEADVCHDIALRQQHGLNKYGKTVADNPLNLLQWLQHAYEESLDFSVYLKRAMQEIGKSQSFTVTNVNGHSGEVLLTADYDEQVAADLAAGDQVVLLVLKKRGA